MILLWSKVGTFYVRGKLNTERMCGDLHPAHGTVILPHRKSTFGRINADKAHG